jgi:hypothetical protein
MVAFNLQRDFVHCLQTIRRRAGSQVRLKRLRTPKRVAQVHERSKGTCGLWPEPPPSPTPAPGPNPSRPHQPTSEPGAPATGLPSPKSTPKLPQSNQAANHYRRGARRPIASLRGLG